MPKFCAATAIPSGSTTASSKAQDFGLQIDAKVREAKAVVVLWCTKSVGSRWVAEEADLAHSRGSLVPVKIEACELPVGFRRLDYLELTDWDGAPRDQKLDRLLDELEKEDRPRAQPRFEGRSRL